MNYKGDVGLYLSGAQVPIKPCGIYVTPPTIRQIVQFGEDDFLTSLKIASGDRKFVNSIRQQQPSLVDAEDFIVLSVAMQGSEQIKDEIQSLLDLLFPDFNVSIEPASIDFKTGDEDIVKGQINQFNFESFSNTLNELFWPAEKFKNDFNPANSKAEEIARKLEEGRKKAQKDKGESGGDKTSMFAMYASVLSIALGVSINEIFSYTPFQLYDGFNRYMAKSRYDLYMKIQTTPMMSTEKMSEEDKEHWAINLYHMESVK